MEIGEGQGTTTNEISVREHHSEVIFKILVNKCEKHHSISWKCAPLVLHPSKRCYSFSLQPPRPFYSCSEQQSVCRGIAEAPPPSSLVHLVPMAGSGPRC